MTCSFSYYSTKWSTSTIYLSQLESYLFPTLSLNSLILVHQTQTPYTGRREWRMEVRNGIFRGTRSWMLHPSLWEGSITCWWRESTIAETRNLWFCRVDPTDNPLFRTTTEATGAVSTAVHSYNFNCYPPTVGLPDENGLYTNFTVGAIDMTIFI